MTKLFDLIELRMSTRPLVALLTVVLVLAPTAWSQDDKKEDAKDKDESEAAEKEDAEPDPFEVPDGTPEELKTFVTKMMNYRARVKTREEMIALQKNRMAAVVEATSKIIAAEPEKDLLVFATQQKFAALEGLVRYQPDVADQLADLIESLEGNALPELAKLPAASKLRQAAGNARRMSGEELEGLAEQVLAYIDEYGVDAAASGLASSVGRYMGYAGATESGAVFYERVGAAMEKSENPAFVKRAAKMIGAARMLRLPGKQIEVFGTSPDGSEFSWASYRGKVVLVDFWASWCGPCIGELPNMKRNLTRYGDKGFSIVGINLDSTRNAFEKCIEEKEITWENLLGNADGAGGWDHPMATYYGISAIPTAILVDQEGKVVSLRARGKELDRLLEDILGPVEEPDSDSDSDEEADDDK
jgi:thiol-disulfide isomerase/thioredoxin